MATSAMSRRRRVLSAATVFRCDLGDEDWAPEMSGRPGRQWRLARHFGGKPRTARQYQQGCRLRKISGRLAPGKHLFHFDSGEKCAEEHFEGVDFLSVELVDPAQQCCQLFVVELVEG